MTNARNDEEMNPPTKLIDHLHLLVEDSLRYSSIGTVMGIESPWLGRAVVTAGFANSEKTIPVGRDNLFQIGSQTKMFTAVCIHQLVGRGLLSLDSKVSDVLPIFPGDDAISVGQLLNHTSGIGNPSRLLDPINRPVDFRLSFDERMFLTRVARESFQPGSNWEYNNAGYWALSEIVSTVSELSYSEYLRKFVLSPLNLNDTFIGSDYDFQVERMARGFHTDSLGNCIETTAHECLAEAGAAGDLVSSIDDMLDWLASLIDANSKTEVNFDELLKNVVPSDTDTMPNVAMYGSGIQEFQVAGRECWGHGGAMCGYMSIGMIEPKTATRICVLSNKMTQAGPAWMALQAVGFNLVPMVMCVLREYEPDIM